MLWDDLSGTLTEFFSCGDDPEDLSKYPFPNTIWNIKPVWEMILKTMIFIPIIVLGSFGNIVVISVFKYRSLRTPTNLIIANMAVADLFQLLICSWMFLLKDFYQNYLLGPFACKFEGFFECSLLLVSVMNICAVSYDRLTAIVLPVKYRITKSISVFLIISTWIAGFLMSSPLIVYRHYRSRIWANFFERYCTEVGSALQLYWHILLAVIVWIPLIIMLICYTAIFIKLDKYQQAVHRREHPITVCYKTKVARTIFIVFMSFIVCRIPFTALIFIRGKMGESKDQVNDTINSLLFVSRSLTFLNAAINPVIYGLTNDNFRKAFRSTTLYRWSSQVFGKVHCEKNKKHSFPISWIEQHKLNGNNVHLINNNLSEGSKEQFKFDGKEVNFI